MCSSAEIHTSLRQVPSCCTELGAGVQPHSCQPACTGVPQAAGSLQRLATLDAVQAVASLLRLRDVVQQFIARQDSERVSAFLYAASFGDASTVRQVHLPGDRLATCTGLCWADL